MPKMSDSALRCLLALIQLSFRFDPAEGEWVHNGDWFNRSDIEGECGLSNQGTRDGLNELESIGWARVDRSGRSHHYRLELEVPNRQFTYVPTALLEGADDIASGTELRVVLAVLRGTWGWTCKETDPERGNLRDAHDRWEQFSNRELAKATGRSKTAVTKAAKALQGEWIDRVRPGNGAYQYRFLQEAITDTLGDGSGNRDSFCGGGANDLPPDRQNSAPLSFYRESLPRDKHRQPRKANAPKSKAEPLTSGTGAVLVENQRQSRSEPTDPGKPGPGKPQEGSPTADFNDLSPEKRDLAEKLGNVGVWAGRIAELLSRFSTKRIRANFQLYRRRASEQTIRKPGAWLCQAITQGYALTSSNAEAQDSPPETSSLPPLEHKETVSEEKKDVYVAQGVGEDRFHRCLSENGAASQPQFMYFDPEAGGPTRRR
jgi:hypothetical protein